MTLSQHPLAIRAREYRKKNPEKIAVNERRKNLKFRYGITIEQYDKILDKQNSSCGICHQHEDTLNKRLVVDHCHTTGKVRGLLCPSCNRGLGLLKDSDEVLFQAIAYLNKTTRKKIA